MRTTPCLDECNYLIRFAGRLSAVMSEGKNEIQDWIRTAERQLRSPDLESLQGEQQLEALSLQLRTIWLRYANLFSSRYLKSPPHFQTLHLPSGSPYSFPYDRWNKPASLEARARTYHPVPAEWTAEHMLFSSGMAAISCLLKMLHLLYEPRPGNPLLLHGIGGYFEIMDLMKITHDELFQFQIFNNQELLQQSVARGQSQLLYIEPVYTKLGRLEVLDLDGFINAWHQRPDTLPTTLVLDTTFVGNKLPIKDFLAQLSPVKPRLVIQISSTLKLDQEGLEFSNAGLMSLYSTLSQVISSARKYIRKYQMIMGHALSIEQISALDYPGFLDPEITEQHSTRIFDNNAILARQLKVGPELLFKSKSHPVLQGDSSYPWSVAPFVNVHLDANTREYERELLKYLLYHGAKRRGLTFYPGSSFGFRAHRCETSIQNEQGVQTIRIAMGSRSGPSLQGTIDFLNDISALGSFEKVKEKYPKLAELALARQATESPTS